MIHYIASTSTPSFVDSALVCNVSWIWGRDSTLTTYKDDSWMEQQLFYPSEIKLKDIKLSAEVFGGCSKG